MQKREKLPVLAHNVYAILLTACSRGLDHDSLNLIVIGS